MVQLLTFLVFLFLGLFVGRFNEYRHYKSIRERERATRRIKLDNLKKTHFDSQNVTDQRLVIGSIVVSIDYFKLIAAGIKSIFGGKIKSIESLIDRGRREAILRMKETAIDFDLITNVKIETSSISKDLGRRSVGSIELIAYGTAVKYKKAVK